MKKRNFVVLSTMLVVVLMFIFNGCSSPTKSDGTPFVYPGSVTGRITNHNNDALADAKVSIGEQVTYTDAQGKFYLGSVVAGSSVLVNISKENFVSTQKVIQVIQNRNSNVNATLVQYYTPPIFVSQIEQSLALGFFSEAKIELPANAFVDEQGNAFNGAVRAQTRYFDPTNATDLNAFPGTFSGIQESDGVEVDFESYGFINAAFFDASDTEKKLQLATGKTAEIKVPIPYSLQANAPATMPLWHYNETTGKWIEEGAATKVGNFYEGEVSHFSFWNFDHPIQPENKSTLTGYVLMNDDTPAFNAQVIAMGVDFAGYTTASTNANGYYEISVKASSQVKLTANLGTNTSPQTAIINTPSSNGTLEVVDIIIGDLRFTIKGVLKYNNQPISDVYGNISQIDPAVSDIPFSVWFSTDEDGAFDELDSFGVQGKTIKIRFTVDAGGSIGTVYSPIINFKVPYPGDVYDFGNINCAAAGKVTGRAMVGGEPLANEWITLMEEGQGEESFLDGTTDDNGYFILQGPPNTTLTGLTGHLYYDGDYWICGPVNITFPNSGATANIGNLVYTKQD